MSPAAPPRTRRHAHPSHGPEAQDRAPTGRSSPLRRAGSQPPSRPVHGRSSASFDRSRRPGMRSSVHSASLTIGQRGVGACVRALIVLTAWRDCMRSWETREWAPEHDTERVRGSEAGWGERRAVWDDARVGWEEWETRRRPDPGGRSSQAGATASARGWVRVANGVQYQSSIRGRSCDAFQVRTQACSACVS